MRARNAWKAWIVAVLCMFTALMCHIEWTHINTRKCTAVAIEALDIQISKILGKDVAPRLKHLKESLNIIGVDEAQRLLDAMPLLQEIK